MTIEQVACLADGLSVSARGQTLVLDGTRAEAAGGSVEVSFRIAGTDFVPRVHFTELQLATLTWEELATVLRHVAVHATFGS
jgi:hypothetical protein